MSLTEKKSCLQCGKEFEPRTERSRFCSKHCMEKYSRSKAKRRQASTSESGAAPRRLEAEPAQKKDLLLSFLRGKAAGLEEAIQAKQRW